MGAFDDTICQLRDLGMSKVANIVRDLERDNMTLAGNNFKLREQLSTVTKERDELVAALLDISQVACSLSPEQKIANEALAKVGADKTGEK